MVKADNSWSRGLSLNPDTIYWMDVSDASYYIQNNKNKGSQMGHTEKNKPWYKNVTFDTFLVKKVFIDCRFIILIETFVILTSFDSTLSFRL